MSRRESCVTWRSAERYSRVKAGACITRIANSRANAMLIELDSHRPRKRIAVSSSGDERYAAGEIRPGRTRQRRGGGACYPSPSAGPDWKEWTIRDRIG